LKKKAVPKASSETGQDPHPIDVVKANHGDILTELSSVIASLTRLPPEPDGVDGDYISSLQTRQQILCF
jgi:hypothetical protein